MNLHLDYVFGMELLHAQKIDSDAMLRSQSLKNG